MYKGLLYTFSATPKTSVNDEGDPGPSNIAKAARMRNKTPCRECRLQKIKCTTVTGVCGACEKNGRTCNRGGNMTETNTDESAWLSTSSVDIVVGQHPAETGKRKTCGVIPLDSAVRLHQSPSPSVSSASDSVNNPQAPVSPTASSAERAIAASRCETWYPPYIGYIEPFLEAVQAYMMAEPTVIIDGFEYVDSDRLRVRYHHDHNACICATSRLFSRNWTYLQEAHYQ